MRTALISGITGQDGSYLAELLLEKGYEVHGIVRRSSHHATGRIDHIIDRLTLHTADMTDQASLNRVVADAQPREIYHLAAQSFVDVSWRQPSATIDTTGFGTLRMLEAMRACAPDARFYQASSSEQFGDADRSPQNEHTPFHPRSPYGVAKVMAHQIAVNYRESFGMHVSCGILFNHESERRGHEFVTRKITRQVAEVAAGHREELSLGNLHARRDWGHAADYVHGMWLMLQQAEPDDYVLATGETHSVMEFVDEAVAAADLTCIYVDRDETMMRAADIAELRGDATWARDRLGWEPTVGFKELVRRMVKHDMAVTAVMTR